MALWVARTRRLRTRTRGPRDGGQRRGPHRGVRSRSWPPELPSRHGSSSASLASSCIVARISQTFRDATRGWGNTGRAASLCPPLHGDHAPVGSVGLDRRARVRQRSHVVADRAGCLDDRDPGDRCKRQLANPARRSKRRESLKLMRARARAMTSSTDGRAAASSSIPRRYSCSDLPALAARAASSSRTSSGTPRIVIATLTLDHIASSSGSQRFVSAADLPARSRPKLEDDAVGTDEFPVRHAVFCSCLGSEE